MIQLLLLGNVDIFGDSGARMDAPLRQSKRVALLAFLAAARPTGFHRRDKIAALFWPELPTDRARAVHSCVDLRVVHEPRNERMRRRPGHAHRRVMTLRLSRPGGAHRATAPAP